MSGVGWFFIGLFLGIIGVIIVACMKPNEPMEKEINPERYNDDSKFTQDDVIAIANLSDNKFKELLIEKKATLPNKDYDAEFKFLSMIKDKRELFKVRIPQKMWEIDMQRFDDRLILKRLTQNKAKPLDGLTDDEICDLLQFMWDYLKDNDKEAMASLCENKSFDEINTIRQEIKESERVIREMTLRTHRKQIVVACALVTILIIGFSWWGNLTVKQRQVACLQKPISYFCSKK